MTKRKNAWCLLPLLMSVVALTAGCPGSAGGLPTHKVTGAVTMNGAPVIGATVTFVPQKKGIPAAIGMTDAQGNYTLQTYAPGDGAVEGDFKVTVTKYVAAAAPAEASHDPTGATGASGTPSHGGPKNAGSTGGSALPEKFSKADSSPFMVTVAKGDNTFDLDLQ